MTTMRTNLRRIGFLGLTLALVLTVPTTVTAQTAPATDGMAEVNDRTAQVLEREAENRSKSLESYDEASELYRKAAYVRGEKDVGAVEDLRRAGQLAHYSGRHEQAVKDLRRAGDVARELGMPNETLEAYYEAAWVAQRTGQHAEAYRLVRSLGYLSRDPDFMIDVEPEVVARVMSLTALPG